MVYFALEFFILLIQILRYAVNPWSMWYCQNSALLFKRMMLKPNSWMHNLFLKPCNAHISPKHIWPLAIELIITYVSFFINIGLGITIWILESMEIEHFFLIVIYWVILSIYLAYELFLMLWLNKISTSFLMKNWHIHKKNMKNC